MVGYITCLSMIERLTTLPYQKPDMRDFPLWGVHTHLHLHMTAWSSETPRWTSTTKRLPLSLQLWHKQHSFSPVLQPRAPALILQKKCQNRVTQPSKPNSPALMFSWSYDSHSMASHSMARAHTHTYLPNTIKFSKGYCPDCMFTPLTFPPPSHPAQKWPPCPLHHFWWGSRTVQWSIWTYRQRKAKEMCVLFISIQNIPCPVGPLGPSCPCPPLPFYLRSPPHTALLAGL